MIKEELQYQARRALPGALEALANSVLKTSEFFIVNNTRDQRKQIEAPADKFKILAKNAREGRDVTYQEFDAVLRELRAAGKGTDQEFVSKVAKALIEAQ
jgi:hypothetical protein